MLIKMWYLFVDFYWLKALSTLIKTEQLKDNDLLVVIKKFQK